MAEKEIETLEAVVQLSGVRKAFNIGTPFETEVLHGIDLTLQRGDFCAVVGPSGSGKSTLLNIVGLLDRPSSGTLKIGSEETTVLDDRALTRLRGHTIGFVFQYHHLITAFTALENVMIPMLGAAGFPNAQMRERAAQLIGCIRNESLQLLHVRDGSIHMCRRERFRQCRKEDRRQNADDGHDDKDLYE